MKLAIKGSCALPASLLKLIAEPNVVPLSWLVLNMTWVWPRVLSLQATKTFVPTERTCARSAKPASLLRFEEVVHVFPLSWLTE